MNEAKTYDVTPDPVIASYAIQQDKEDAFNSFARSGGEINDKEAYDIMEQSFLNAYEEFISTPATSLTGLLLQAKYLKEQNEVEEVAIIVSGIENLMDGRKSQPNRSSASDPVIVHGLELARLRAEELAIDEKQHKKDEEVQYAAHSQYLCDKAAALEDLIATMKATSLEGSLLQVALVFNQLNHLDTFEYDEADIRKLFRTCSRLLYSVRDVLQGACSVKPLEIAVPFYMDDNQNPWLNAERRIQITQSHTAAESGPIGLDRPCNCRIE